MPPRNPIAAVGSVRNFMNLVKEVNFDEIRDRAEQAPRILIVAQTEEQAGEGADSLFGEGSGGYVDIRTGDRADRIDLSRYDAAIVRDPERTGLYDQVKKQATGGRTGNLFQLTNDGEEAVSRLRTAIVMADPDLAPAFGRWFVPFRAPAVHAIIDETAKANAKFAFISNVPSIVPLFGGLISASADLIVLTKNQIMMAYKLAAANGRDLSDQTGILRELAPVVGAGFVWRSVAREATSFLPFMAGSIPKVAIAFAGTYSVGLAADYYYRFGKKPTGDQMKAFSQQAIKLAASIPLPGRDRSDKQEEIIEAQLGASVDDAEKRGQQ
ncbi:MAG: hypothetical protein H0T72_03510 [Chloroflexia bacterium]|nr:hypothetical protein [Chloroflexia bacterium]